MCVGKMEADSEVKGKSSSTGLRHYRGRETMTLPLEKPQVPGGFSSRSILCLNLEP